MFGDFGWQNLSAAASFYAYKYKIMSGRVCGCARSVQANTIVFDRLLCFVRYLKSCLCKIRVFDACLESIWLEWQVFWCHKIWCQWRLDISLTEPTTTATASASKNCRLRLGASASFYAYKYKILSGRVCGCDIWSHGQFIKWYT